MLCQVVVSYPVLRGQKPPPRTQLCVSGRENLWTGQTKHALPAGVFKNNLKDCCCCHVVPSCRELPGTSRTKTATTHATLRFRPGKFAQVPNRVLATSWHFKNNLGMCCCCHVVLRSRVSAYPILVDFVAAKKKIHRRMRAELSSAMRSSDRVLDFVCRCCCENQCREHISKKTHTNKFCGK